MTATMTDNYTQFCKAAHHRDTAEIGICDDCGFYVYVIKNDKGWITLRDYASGRTVSAANRFMCFETQKHECNPEAVALHTAGKEAKVAAGEIVKGCNVRVVSGRKVPLDTVGKVFWIGTDSYGTTKVGFVTDAGEKHFTAITNLQVEM